MRITRAFRKNFKTIKFKETRIRENLKKKEKSVAKNKKKVGFWVVIVRIEILRTFT